MSTEIQRSVVIDGFTLFLDAHDSLGLAAGHAFEPEVANALLQWVRPGDVVADIGANIGYFTVQLARLVGDGGRVHAFEPEPLNLALLERNALGNGLPNVHVHGVALGAHVAVVKLHTSDFNGGMHRVYDSVLCVGAPVSVPLCTLDEIMAGQALDLIKIDIEGYEPKALRGAHNTLRQSPQLKIISEYCPASMLEAACSPLEFLSDMAALGYHAQKLTGAALDDRTLRDDARRYEAFGSERFVRECQGMSPPVAIEHVQRLAASLGCVRPIIENLLFVRQDVR